MQLLPAIIERARSAVKLGRKVSDNPQNLFRMFVGGWWPAISYDQTIGARAAMVHPVVARCLNRIALSVQQVEWQVERVREDGTVIEADNPNAPRKYTKEVEKALALFFQHPHDSLSASDLRYWMALNRAAYGRFYILITRDSRGQPNGIYPLPAEKMSVKIGANGTVDGYVLQTNSGTKNYKTKAQALAEDEKGSKEFPAYVVHVSIPGLELSVDDLTINSPLHSIGLPSAIVDQLMRRAFDTASGHPNSRYVVTADSTLTQGQYDEYVDGLKKRQTGQEESGQVIVMTGTNIKTTKLDNDLSDIHSKMPLDDMTRMIAGAFNIPIALLGLGAADGAKFANNYDGSRLSFWEDTIIPTYLTPIAEALTAAVCPEGYRVRFRLDTIPALQSARVSRMTDLSAVTFITNDEKRAMCGLPPLRADQELPTPASAKPPPKVTEPA